MGKARILGNIGTNAGNLATTSTGTDYFKLVPLLTAALEAL